MLYLLQFYWFRFLNPLSIWCSHLRLKELLVYTHKFRVFRVTLYNVAMQITSFENTFALLLFNMYNSSSPDFATRFVKGEVFVMMSWLDCKIPLVEGSTSLGNQIILQLDE